MENATKALLMAGGLLIAILVASFMVLVLRKGGQMNAEYDRQLSENELAKWNAQFELYDKTDNTFFDIITVANLAYDINKKNGYDDSNSVVVKIYLEKNDTVNYSIEAKPISKNYFLDSKGNEKYMYDVMDENKFDDTTYDVATQTLTYNHTFKCEGIQYNEITGKVKEINFRLN